MNIWEYEKAKNEIIAKNLPAKEYEIEIKKLLQKLDRRKNG